MGKVRGRHENGDETREFERRRVSNIGLRLPGRQSARKKLLSSLQLTCHQLALSDTDLFGQSRLLQLDINQARLPKTKEESSKSVSTMASLTANYHSLLTLSFHLPSSLIYIQK